MNRIICLLLFQWLLAGAISAQDSTVVPQRDSLPQKDTVQKRVSISKPVTVARKPAGDTILPVEDSVKEISLPVDTGNRITIIKPARLTFPGNPRLFQGKEVFFYSLLALLLIFALLRRMFPKYFNDLFRLVFRSSVKERQIREQLIQTPLPSLLLNIFFVITAGLYLDFIFRHYHLSPVGNFWLMFLYCALGLAAVYTGKFLALKISGWVFSMKEAADSYIFIVFVINKMIGIFLLPFLLVLAFSEGKLYSIALTLSWCVIACLLIYRFILTFAVVRNQVKVNPFHFFLYLCAFEIAPLLLIYRVLLLFLRITP